MTNLTVKILEVEATRSNLYGETGNTYTFKAYEFSNGLILVPGETTNDWFFEDKESIEACGCDIIGSVEEIGETVNWTFEELLEAVRGSIEEFGSDSVPQKYLELF